MKIYYVNEKYGLDTNNGLVPSKSFKTLQALLNSVSSFTENTTIYLSSGLYTCNNTIITKVQSNVILNVIGIGSSTTFKPTIYFGYSAFGSALPIGSTGATINLNRLVWDMKSGGSSSDGVYQVMRCNLNLNNVVMINIEGAGGTFSPYNSIYVFTNCIFYGANICKLTSYLTNTFLYNCYGYYNIDSIGNNVKTSSPLVNNLFQITDENIPETIGVYYGEYSWILFLIKCDNNYYSVYKEYYSKEFGEYVPLDKVDFSKGFSTEMLNDILVIDSEMQFRPIEKFDNFTLVTKTYNSIYYYQGITSSSELITASNDINTSIAHNINYFKVSGNGLFKIVFSIDEGLTWQSYYLNELITLTNTTQGLKYENNTCWDLLKTEIIEKGMDVNSFNNFDFNQLSSKTIRFAYVLIRDNYSTVSEVSNLDWKFDAKGHWRQLSDDVYDMYVYDRDVRLKIGTEVKINITPTMTSNVSPSPYIASSSSQHNTSYAPWLAFNNKNSANSDCWITLNGVNTGWIQLDFNKQTIVNRVAITSRYSLTNVGETIKDFSIQGSNDGVTWNTIKSYSNEPTWAGNETRMYELDRVVSYRYYRINVTANHGYASYLSVGMIRFFGGDVEYPMIKTTMVR